MLDIEVPFSLPIGYDNSFVTVRGRSHVVAFHLKEGTHVARSEPVDLGVVHGVGGRRLLGEFSFEYTYEPERRVVTVNGSDFDSARSMCLITTPEGTGEFCRQRVAGGFLAEDLTGNPRWNYVTYLTPGLRDVFAGLVRTVNDRAIEALQKVPGMIVQVRTHPPQLSAEEQQQFLYESGGDVFTVDSVWGGVVTLKYSEAFANVIGSSQDPKIGGMSWIRLWEQQYGVTATICTSYQFKGFPCNYPILGGHVISGQHAETVHPGSNSVWIFPICQQHNNNDNVYMAALRYLNGIWLKNYMHK